MLGGGNHVMLIIKILGSGCPNCRRLEAETRAALDAAVPSIAYELIKVTDYADIVACGVMSTPALVMNEQVLSTGRIPKRDQIIAWARGAGSG
jgi:small redox-active disulfide protein 2